jgi:hypothetical protein
MLTRACNTAVNSGGFFTYRNAMAAVSSRGKPNSLILEQQCLYK